MYYCLLILGEIGLPRELGFEKIGRISVSIYTVGSIVNLDVNSG